MLRYLWRSEIRESRLKSQRIRYVKQWVDTSTMPIVKSAESYAPSNIALCKYWGKRNRVLNLPLTDSLSVSLGTHGSHCRLTLADYEQDHVILDGKELPKESPFARRLTDYLDLFRPAGTYGLICEATNTVPTAAGLASSASGFASVIMALNQLLGWNLDDAQLSILARLGSGSASRSLWHGFVHWHAGSDPDGTDSFAVPVDCTWPEVRIGVVMLSTAKKPISSTDAMNLTTDTSHLYQSWPAQVAHDLGLMQQAICSRDFDLLGQTAEHNAMSMHATMISSKPSVLYWSPETVAAIHQIHRLRSEGVAVYLTIDAGPNIKLLYQKQDEQALLSTFSSMVPINPWLH